MLAAFDITADPWAFQLHLEVWGLVAFLIGAWVYSVRVIGPRAVGPGGVVVTNRQKWLFVFTMIMLWGASDWPVHDIGEKYLYSVHMFQHMVLAYLLPPLALLSMPEWLLRLIVGQGRGYTFVKFMSKPAVAGVLFNLTVMVTHIPGVVNTSTQIGVLHYSIHFLLVMSALLMWMPVLGPFKELHISYPARMGYLFLQSIVPTVPAGWLTFAEGPVYKHYNVPVRVWGLTVANDQQIAGAIMKVGGSFYLWGIIIYMYFGPYKDGANLDSSYIRKRGAAANAAAGDADMLTYEHVTSVFDKVPPAPEPERSN
ncbi:MAG: cytochrome c oxidase assembly protein [Actinomycetota bacterium]|jgi:putative membrane protein